MVKSTILGYPRIGIKRELKKAIEQYWKKNILEKELKQIGKTLRKTHWERLKKANLDYIPSGDFSYYDHVLDIALTLGAIPERYHSIYSNASFLDSYFTMARGNQDIPAMEMTKWFDTNYHYIVPEFEYHQSFQVNAKKYIDHFQEAQSLGIETRPVIIGPISFLMSGKIKSEKHLSEIEKLEHLLPETLSAYQTLLQQFEQSGIKWVQLDEPFLVTDLSSKHIELYKIVYQELQKSSKLNLFLTSYFGGLKEHLSQILTLSVDAIHIDLVQGKDSLDHILKQFPESKILSLGLVDVAYRP